MPERRRRGRLAGRLLLTVLVGAVVGPALAGVAPAVPAARLRSVAPAAAQAADGSVPAEGVTVPGPVRFELTDGGLLQVDDGRRYRDTLELRAAGGGTLAVNELSMDDYVAGVAEMPSRWPVEALKAQAVAARTYAWYSQGLGTFDGYDLCATVACQVFLGADKVLEDSGGDRWQQAVDATAGEVLVYDGRPILARYFSTSGGRTYANEEAFPNEGPRPYLVSIEDPDDAVSPYHRWTARFTREEWDTILAQGETLAATVPVAGVERLGAVDDPNADVRVTGEDGTVVEVGARALADFLTRIAPQRFPDRFPGARSDGLRPLPATVPSSRFAPSVTDDAVVLEGQGWGHGVGLGQYGARGRADRGETYEQILAAYYDGLEPTRPDELPDRIRVGFEVADQLTVAPDHPVRIVADGQEVTARTFGRWSVTRDGDGFRLVPPPQDDVPLEVAPTRTEETVTDAVVVATEVNKPALLRLEVTDADGDQVVRRELGVADPGAHAATWRFHDDAGEVVDPGSFQVALVAEDAAGASAGQPVDVEVSEAAAAAAERTREAAGDEALTEVPTLPALVGTAVRVLVGALVVLVLVFLAVGTVRRRRT
jgi:SpoIID/LytB domain protein